MKYAVYARSLARLISRLRSERPLGEERSNANGDRSAGGRGDATARAVQLAKSESDGSSCQLRGGTVVVVVPRGLHGARMRARRSSVEVRFVAECVAARSIGRKRRDKPVFGRDAARMSKRPGGRTGE